MMPATGIKTPNQYVLPVMGQMMREGFGNNKDSNPPSFFPAATASIHSSPAHVSPCPIVNPALLPMAASSALAATTHRPPGGPHDEVVAIQVPIQ
jgi:hypothetical protein